MVAKQRLRFLRAMNHDLRNPIATQLNLIESLLDGIPGPITDRQNTYLQRLDERTHLLLALLDDVMELAGRSPVPGSNDETLLEISSISGSLNRLMSPLAIRVGKVVRADFATAAIVRCQSAADLKLLVLSLGAHVLGNAGKGGELLLQLRRTSDEVILDIRDAQFAPQHSDSVQPAIGPKAETDDLQTATVLAGRLGVTWAPLVEAGRMLGFRVSL